MVLKIFNRIERLKREVFSFVYRNQFRSCGKSVRIEKLGKLIGPKYITIGDNSDIQQMTYLTAWDNYNGQQFTPEINIGNDCHIGAFNHITSVNMIVIGDGFVSGKWVTVTDNSHGEASTESFQIPVGDRPIVSKGPVVIGKNVWVGDKATILPGVTIGDGVVIGANSVVTKDIPAYSIACGNPAIVIKRITKE